MKICGACICVILAAATITFAQDNGTNNSGLVLLDVYNDISSDEEIERLGNFALLLREQPQWRGYIMVYAGRRARIGEARARGEHAKRCLVNIYRIEADRITTLDGGHQEELRVELWSGHPKLPEPASLPTVDSSQVEIIRGNIVINTNCHTCSTSRNRRRRRRN